MDLNLTFDIDKESLERTLKYLGQGDDYQPYTKAQRAAKEKERSRARREQKKQAAKMSDANSETEPLKRERGTEGERQSRLVKNCISRFGRWQRGGSSKHSSIGHSFAKTTSSSRVSPPLSLLHRELLSGERQSHIVSVPFPVAAAVVVAVPVRVWMTTF
eukprot:scaffold1522_cov166-Amphora_coffeaeformis.AAC.16